MGAPARVSTQEIVNALLEWQGDVANAARAVGLSRNGLYQRIERLGLDLDRFRNASRSNPAIPITRVSMVPTMPSNVSGAQRRPSAQENASAIFPREPARRRLAAMEQATSTADDKTVPIKTAPRRHQPIRIKPDQRDLLQRAAWDLQSRFQAPTDESLILEQFIEEAFPGWLAGKVQKNGKAEKKKGSGA